MNTNKRRILLAEDSEVITFIMKEFLRKIGFDVACVDNGQAAIEFADQSFDLIIMDIHIVDGHPFPASTNSAA